MKLTIEQPNLMHILTQATSVVERRNTIPILANVKLTATDGKLHALATDLDIEVSTVTTADIDTDGATTVNAGMLADIVKRLPKGNIVSIYVDNNMLHIASGKSQFNLSVLPVNDFPVMASDTYDNTVILPCDVIAPIFNNPSFAMSTEEIKYYLNGIYLHNDDDGFLCGVATDGHRLAKATTGVTDVLNSVIVPRKTVNELRKLLIGGGVEVSTSETKIKFVTDDFTLVSKVIDGTYPDYKRIIPTSNDNIVTVSAKDFSDAAGRVTIVSDERVRAVKLALSGGACVMSVRGANSDAVDEVAIEYDGPDIEIGFSSKYLAEVMAQANGGNVALKFGDTQTPIVVVPDCVDGFMSILMPMRF